MKIGAHVSTSGGLQTAIDRASTIGAEAIQIFASSPRAWKFRSLKEEQILSFKEKSDSGQIEPTFIHGSYLVNIGGAPELVEKSITCLIDNMNAANQLGAEGVIFLCGSLKGRGFDAIFDQATEALRHVLDQSPEEPYLILENSAGSGDHVGAKFNQIGRMINAIGSDQVKVCLDTQHSFAAGYNLTTSEGVSTVMEEFDREIGLDRLAVVHANDSKVDFCSGVDRHENIGDGYMGTKAFKAIMAHEAFKDTTFLLEVPGIDGEGPDAENVCRMKKIRAEIGTDF